LTYCRKLGPIIGGLLARPAERFPDLFGENEFLQKYPYFLPCAIPAAFSFIAWLVTFFFLKETLHAPISIAQLFNITRDRKQLTLQNGTGSTDPSVTTISSQNEHLEDNRPEAERPLPLRSLLTPRVLIAGGNYASVSLVEIAFRAIQPLFLSTPIHLGGLGLPIPSIGTLLSVQAILGGIFQVFFFARIHDRWGSKKTFMVGVASAIPVFVMFPVANAFARTQGYGIAVWTAIGIQIIAGLSFGLCWGQFSFYNLRADKLMIQFRCYLHLHRRLIP
jgi:Major Facilitator Superfamily